MRAIPYRDHANTYKPADRQRYADACSNRCAETDGDDLHRILCGHLSGMP